MQREFRKTWLFAGTLLTLSVFLFRAELNRLPNRIEFGERTIPLRFQPVELGPGSLEPVRLVGAWRLFADDKRFGGISALAVDGKDLVALTDSGVAARFAKPGGSAARLTLKELPGGPRDGGFKVNRDTEALVAAFGGWAVAFENRDEIWVYDRGFTQVLGRFSVRNARLSRNRGIEGMVAERGRLILFPEWGGRAIRDGKRVTISGVAGWLSDAARLPDGQILVVNRRPTPIGLSNFLVSLRRDGPGYAAAARWRIPVGRLDNVEALAAEPMPGGGVRFWVMTDNNLQQRRPTLLLALELRPRPAPRSS